MKRDLLLAACIAAAIMLMIVATREARAGEAWLVGTVASYHIGTEKKYEQQNWGLGIEQRMTETFAVTGGMYRNSNRRDSLYVGVAWMPIRYGWVSAGAAALLVSGYETAKNPELVKAVLPVVSVERKGYGINVPFVPKTKDNSGAIGLQLKVRF